MTALGDGEAVCTGVEVGTDVWVGVWVKAGETEGAFDTTKEVPASEP
jgi:hypothetical protein